MMFLPERLKIATRRTLVFGRYYKVLVETSHAAETSTMEPGTSLLFLFLRSACIESTESVLH